MKETYRIGEKVIVEQDSALVSMLTNQRTEIKQGDKGIMNSMGQIYYTTGNARGKVHALDGISVHGYDTENIAKMVYERISRAFNLDYWVEYEGYDKYEAIDEIEDILNNILI